MKTWAEFKAAVEAQGVKDYFLVEGMIYDTCLGLGDGVEVIVKNRDGSKVFQVWLEPRK